MKTLFITFLKVEGKNIKFKAALILLILTAFGSVLYLKQSSFNDLETITAGEVVGVNSALDLFRKVDATDPKQAPPLYSNLIRQSSELGNRTLGIKFNDSNTYLKGALELSQIRAEAYQMDNYDKVSPYLQTERENKLNEVFYSYLNKSNQEIYINNENFPSYILLVITIAGSVWYLFSGILSSDIILNDEEHLSITRSYPFSAAIVLLSKVLNYITILFVFITSFLILSILTGTLIYGVNFEYPIAIFGMRFQTINTLNFILIAWVYLTLISIVAVLVSVLLNYYIKNLYIVIFIHVFIFFLSILTERVAKWTWFLPFNYLDFTRVFTGINFEISKSMHTHILYGAISLSITIISIVLFILFKFSISDNAKEVN